MFNMSPLVQVMDWHQTGAKPLPESMMTQFNDTYINGLVQDSSNSITNTLESLQSCTKPYVSLGLRKWNQKER